MSKRLIMVLICHHHKLLDPNHIIVWSYAKVSVFKHVFLDICIPFLSFIYHLCNILFKCIFNKVDHSGHP
jgi:hypothetical protein